MKMMIKAGLVLAGIALLAACGSETDAPDPENPGWAAYENEFLKACKAGATDEREAIMAGLCGCTLNRIKSGYSLKFVEKGQLTKDIVQNLSAECTASLKIPGGRFPEMAREQLVSSCTEEAGGLGDKAGAYCECSVARLEKDFSYDQVMHGLVSQSDYEALGAACVAEVGAGG